MLNEKNLQIVLDRLLTVKSFMIFAKLSNLNNNDNYRKIIEMLYYNKISLDDLNSIPMLDDEAISVFIRDFEELYNPTIVSTDSTPGSYSFLMGTDSSPSILNRYVQAYNNYYSSFIYEGMDMEGEVFPPIYTQFGLEKGSPYNTYSDYYTAFTNYVLTPLLKKYNVEEIGSLFPKFDETKFDQLSGNELAFLRQSYDLIFKDIKAYFNNDKLAQLLVWTDDYPSLFASNIRLFNDILNIKSYSKITPIQLRAISYELANRGSLEYTATQVNELKNTKVFDFSIRNFTLTDSLGYVAVLWSAINTIEQNNNLPISTQFLVEFNQLYTIISKFQDLYFEIVDLITKNLHVKVE